MRLEWVENCIAWGPVLGRNAEFPDLIECGSMHYRHSYPGMLVHSYEGGLNRMKARGLDRPGLGIVLAVVPMRPEDNPQNDRNSWCLVLWNW